MHAGGDGDVRLFAACEELPLILALVARLARDEGMVGGEAAIQAPEGEPLKKRKSKMERTHGSMKVWHRVSYVSYGVRSQCNLSFLSDDSPAPRVQY